MKKIKIKIGSVVSSGMNVLEWLYLVQCDNFIALCRAMSGPPSGYKIVCAVVALPGAKRSLHTPQPSPPPATVLRSPLSAAPPLFAAISPLRA